MNIANQITVSRIILTFVFIGLALGAPSWSLLAYFIGIIAGLSDFFDGYLARKYNLVTDFGILFDPLADKIFIISVFVVFLHLSIIPVSLVLVILVREFCVTGLRLVAVGKNVVIAANWGGKLKTTLQFIYLAIMGAVWVGFIPNTLVFIDFLMYTTLIVTVYTGVEYFIKYSHLYMQDL